jgi:trk system potassium uptake protein TrkH
MTITPSRTICLGFLALILIGTFLLMLPWSVTSGHWGNSLTALFIATSAVCVTGLSTVDVGSYYTPIGQGVLLFLFQVGGLGYMTATTFLLVLIGRRFSLREKVTLQQSLDLPGIQGGARVVKSIIATTLLFELSGTFALIPAFTRDNTLGQSLWLALFHSVSAFNNAGFSLFQNNLINYVDSPLVNGVISLLIISGGIGYQVILEFYLWLRSLIQGKRNSFKGGFSLNFKVATTTTLLLLTVGTVTLLLTEFVSPQFLNLSWTGKLWASWFQSVSTRTAGFNTIDLAVMTPTSLFAMIILMFIGASPGGTGGGVKTTTIRILSSCTESALHGREEVCLYDRQIPSVLIFKAVGVVVGSVMVVITATTLLSMTEREISFIQILFEATSAFATVGLSTGITASVSAWGQMILIMTMYIGRVGIFLLMAAISGTSRPSLVKYPEGYLLVG